ncbi:CHAT domain-containing protein [Streptomyces sp. NPDC014995]|uniref:CHAT domain-containing protein n=1 Tax=Streptomyces sp. NPDC014995 TaxID=3364936 RepID=UPI0036FCC4ED
MARYLVSGSVSDLDAVIHTGETHRTVLAADRETEAHSLRTLCFALRQRASLQNSLADFDTALRYGEELLRLVPRDDPGRPMELHFVRAVPTASRFELSGDPADLNLSIAADEEALENCSTEHGAVEICRFLCNSLRRRFVELRDTGDLWTAALHAQRLLAGLSAEHPARAFVLWDLARVSADLSRQLPDAGHLHAAIGYARAALEASPRNSADAEACRAMLTQLLAALGVRTDDATALDQAVAIGEESWEEASPGRRDALAAALWTRYRAGSVGADLDRAIEVREDLLSETTGGAGDGADRSRQLRALAELLEERHARADTPGDLSRSMALLDEAAELSETDRPDAWFGISRLLLRRYRSHRHPADIERAIELLEGAIPLVPADSPRRGAFARQLLMCIQERGETTEQPDPAPEPTLMDPWDTTSDTAEPGGHEADVAASVLLAGALLSDNRSGRSVASLDQAVEVLRGSLGSTPAGHPLRGLLLSNLCHTIRIRFEATGRRSDLEEAIAHGRAATEDLRETEPWAYASFTSLSAAHHTRFLETGRAQDLVEALTASRRAVPLSAEGLPRVHALVQLGAMLIQKYDVMGSSDDLDDAIVHLEQAAAWRGPDGERDPGALSEYSIALRTRYGTLGTLEDLAKAVELARQSVASPNLPPELAPSAANNLGLALLRRAERFHSETDATEAVDLFRRCVDGSRHDRHLLAGASGNLSWALDLRYELTKQTDDLVEAARVAKAAAESAGHEHAERGMFLSRLCSIHGRLYLLTGQQEALDQAADYGRQAVRAAAPPHPQQAAALVNLGSVLRVRGGRTAHAADLREARDHLAQAMRHDSTSPEVKTVAAMALGRLAARAGDWEPACEAYGNAIALRELSSRHEPGGDAVYQLDRFHDLASDAAACHLARDDLRGAIESWEKGRAGLLARELDIRHPDLDRLESRDAEKAARLMQLLDRASSSSAAGRQAQREAADILTEVRQWDGFESFLRPPRLPDLLEIVGDEPLVLVTLSDICSYAVIIGKGGCSHVPLHDLTPLVVMERLSDLARAVDSRPRDEPALHRLLVWLGESLVEPVLRALRQSAQGTAPDRRLRWLLSGWLAMLPVQAALVSPEDGGERVPAFTLFSPVFSSGLQGLQQARAREQRIEPDAQRGKDVLAVALPTTPGLPAMPFAALEVRVLKNAFGERLRPVLLGEKATRAAVMAELPASTIAHFACHGTNDPFYPTRSALMLHDHRNKPLTVRDLLTLNLPKAGLAYLSACSTASPGLMAAEQAIHPASAFQAAGYPTVIGTLWDVNDAGAAAVARAVYARIAEKGVRSAHLALSSACAEVYRANRERPSLWAAYVCYAP